MPADAELIFAEHAARLYARHHGFPPMAGRLLGYLAISPDAPLEKIGCESQYEVYAAVAQATGRAPVVIDSADLVRRPADTVRAYCAAAGIGFRPEALRWQPSDRPEWELSRAWHAGRERGRRA